MINLTKLAALIVMTSNVVPAAQSRVPQDAAVQAVDARYREAMTLGNVGELELIVADDATIIHGNRGGIQGKAALIKEFRSYGIKRYERTPIRSTINGGSAILVSATHKFFAGGQKVEATTTEVLVRRSGRWQILVLQNTDHGS